LHPEDVSPSSCISVYDTACSEDTHPMQMSVR
jgi:hypothetical protein